MPGLLRAICPIVVLVVCSCGRDSEEWRIELRSSDPFSRFLAAVALASEEGDVPDRAVDELIRATKDADLRLRATAERLLERRPDQALRRYFRLLEPGRSVLEYGSSKILWGGTEFECELLDRLTPALRHPDCDLHVELCGLVSELPDEQPAQLRKLSAKLQRETTPESR